MESRKTPTNYLPEFIRRVKLGLAVIAGYFTGHFLAGLSDYYQSGLFVGGFAVGLLAVQGLFRLLAVFRHSA